MSDNEQFKVRIIFEVSDLKYATLATVSRCGMIWFSEDVVNIDVLFDNYLAGLRNASIVPMSGGDGQQRNLHVQSVCAQALADHFR